MSSASLDRYLSFLGYVRIDKPFYRPHQSFPIPMFNGDIQSKEACFTLGIELPSQEYSDFINYHLNKPYIFDKSIVGIADVHLSEYIICPFIYLYTPYFLVCSPVYLYEPMIDRYLKNSKLTPNRTLKVEFYSDNIEILSFKLLDVFDPNILSEGSGRHSKFPLYSISELSSILSTVGAFEEITQGLLEQIFEQHL